MDVYGEWLEKTEELWRQRCRDFLGDEYARLLAVARAAYIYDYCMDEDIERKERLLLIMRAALADVEDLL